MSRAEMVARGNLEMYAAGLEARVDILEASNAELKRRIRLARKDLRHVRTGTIGYAELLVRGLQALDLRRPLRRKT